MTDPTYKGKTAREMAASLYYPDVDDPNDWPVRFIPDDEAIEKTAALIAPLVAAAAEAEQARALLGEARECVVIRRLLAIQYSDLDAEAKFNGMIARIDAFLKPSPQTDP